MVACMHQGKIFHCTQTNHYNSPYKPEISSILFTIICCIFYFIGPNMTTNPKLKNPPQRLKLVSIIILILLTICLSFHNSFLDCHMKAIQMSIKSWCYGDSRGTYDHVIMTRQNKMVEL